MLNGDLVLGRLGRLGTADAEGIRFRVKRFSWAAVREWAGICLWAVFCLACGGAGLLAALIR